MKNNKKLHQAALALAVILFLTLVTSTASADPVQDSTSWPYAYITNYADDTVSVIDINTNTVTATIPVGITPFGVVISPEATKVYVTNWGSNNVSVIDTATNTVINTVPVGSEPKGIAINPEGTKVYVANTNSTTVSVIDTATDTVTATVNVGSYPLGVAVNSVGTKAYVTNYGSNTVSVIDTATNEVTATVKVGSVPSGVVVNPAGTKVYVANSGSTTLSVINTTTNTVTATVNVGRSPFGVAIVAGSKLYVTNSLGNTVSIINTATNAVTATVPVGINPVGIAVNPSRSKVYVANHASNTVSIIDVAKKTVTDTVSVGSGPTAFGQFMISSPINVGANLSIYKQAPSSITSGSSMTYTLYYYNFGNKDARNVNVEDILSGDVEFESASDGGVYNSDTRTVTWDIGSVSPEGNGYRTVKVKIPQSVPVGNVIYNSASISTSDPETNYDDNKARAWTWVISKYHDPAGGIYDVDTLEPISNASVWLQIPDGIGGWENVPTGESVPIAQPDKNPLTTDENGMYKWDVLDGFYRVHIEAPGYEPADSIVVSIPPAVTDLDVGLTPIPVLPVANFTSNVTSGNVPLSVQFTDLSENATEWNWDFGDETNSTDQNPMHTFSTAGEYTVNLTVSNSLGTDSKLATITVSEKPVPILPVANFSANPTSGKTPLKVKFNDTSTGSPTSWFWNFGDGSKSYLQDPVHKYSKAGTYTVNLTVKNAKGKNTVTKTEYIKVITKPAANFSANPTSGKTPLKVKFTDTSTGIPAKWRWDFGDGAKSFHQNPIHKYSKAGTYTVNLTVKNAKGKNTVTKTQYIKVITKPVANFTSSVTSGKTPFKVKFSDTSTGTPAKWIWDFGDEAKSFHQNPIHKYSKAGTYTVNLTVKNAAGRNMVTKTDYIKVTA